MAQTALQKLREKFSLSGLEKNSTNDQDFRFFDASELACLKRQLQTGNQLARDAAKRHGAKLHPRIAALKATVEQ